MTDDARDQPLTPPSPTAEQAHAEDVPEVEPAPETFPDEAADLDAAHAESASAPPVQYGVGPFSLREVVLGGIWLLAFVFSFFPRYVAAGNAPSVWTGGLDWILTIAVPTAAVFLLALRRLSPQGIRRVGSLGIDQFASVAFSVAAVTWITTLWTLMAGLPAPFLGSTWPVWIESVLMLGGVVFTVFAPLLPVFREDFRFRPESVAHPVARTLRPVAPRPAAPRPEPRPAAPEGAAGNGPADATGDAETLVVDTLVVDTAEDSAPAPQAFWVLAPEERDVHDETGAPLFRIGPTAWALVIEDRGEVFVVRHEDGRIGYLHDVSGVTRG